MFHLQHTDLGFLRQEGRANDYGHKGQTKHEDRQIIDRNIIDRKMGKDWFAEMRTQEEESENFYCFLTVQA